MDVAEGLTTIVLIFFVPLLLFGLIAVPLHRWIGRKFVGSISAQERGQPEGLEKFADVRFGSLADMTACQPDVRFTPNSGHCSDELECPLSAKSGHCHQNGTACSMRVRYIALNSL